MESKEDTAAPFVPVARMRFTHKGTELDLVVTEGTLGTDTLRVHLCRTPFELMVVDGRPSPMSVADLPVPR